MRVRTHAPAVLVTTVLVVLCACGYIGQQSLQGLSISRSGPATAVAFVTVAACG